MQITIRLEGDGAQKILNFILIWGKKKCQNKCTEYWITENFTKFQKQILPVESKAGKKIIQMRKLDQTKIYKSNF